MKKNNTIYGLSILLALAALTMANSGGTPGGYSGSSTDGGATCASGGGCHASATSTKTAQDMISSDIPSSGYEPGKEYTITLSPSVTGISKWGFEMMVENSAGSAVGTFSNSTDVNTKDGGLRATHKSTSNTGTDGRSWDITWTAPAVGSGDLKIYASSLSANGNGGNSGDNVLIDTISITEGEVNSIVQLGKVSLNIYPNPVSDVLLIKGLGDLTVDHLAVIDINGREVINTAFVSSLDVTSLQSGTYYLEVTSGNNSVRKPFIKK